MATAPQSAAPAAGPQTRKLKKGELLFSEGEGSRAMYFLKTGMIRIFKKKGDAYIELDTIRAGQVLGELAFLDGNPRSASGEALTDCELMEISGPAFQQVLASMPEWLKILLRTVVGRLRTAGTRIRQLESASVAVDYSDKSGKRSTTYMYLTPTEVMKCVSAVLLAYSRYGKPGEGGTHFKHFTLNKFACQIMQLPSAKLTSCVDLLVQNQAIKVISDDVLCLVDADFLDQIVTYINDENMLEQNKRHDISVRAFMIMSYIVKHIELFPAQADGSAEVNLAEVKKRETASNGGKEAFRFDEIGELIKVGYMTNVSLKSSDKAMSTIQRAEFLKAFRNQKFIMSLNALNQEKRK